MMETPSLDQESIPEVGAMSDETLRKLFEHMREHFPGTLIAALAEMRACDDVASHATEKTSNTKAYYTQSRMDGGLNTIPDDCGPGFSRLGSEGDEPPLVALKRVASDEDGGDQPPSLPARTVTVVEPEPSPDDIQHVTEQELPVPKPESPDDVPSTSIPQLITSKSKQVSSGDLQPKFPTRKEYKPSLPSTPSSEEGCYLVYDSDGAKLMLHYSATAVPNALGFWCPGEDKKIPSFKFKQNAGRSELIGNCASGVAGRKNFYSGWCQYIRAARALNGCITMIPPSSEHTGLPVDVFLYLEEDANGKQTVKLQDNTPFDISAPMLAVACLPKHSTFYESMKVDLNKWLTEANSVGAGSRFS